MRKICDRHHVEYEVETGELLWHPLNGNSCWGRPDCPQCQEEHARLKWTKRLLEARVPLRYQERVFDDFDIKKPGQQRALEAARQYVSEFDQHLKVGRCLLFVGGVGAGKTHLACAIIAALLSRGNMAQYFTVMELLRSLRDTWKREAKLDEDALLDRYAKLDLLVIDEVGVQFGTNAEQIQFTEILDRRYRNVKPTLLISNLDLANLKQCIGERVVDRLSENGGKVVAFDWPSHRGASHG